MRQDADTCFCLEGGLHPTHQKLMPVAWVEIGKAYVSYHHMGVYAHPKVLDNFSAKLKKRMQGKSCFNFKTVDEVLFKELEQLTVAAFAPFRKGGFPK